MADITQASETGTTQALKDAQVVTIDQIDPNPYQPRGKLAAADVKELTESIKEVGLLQPILVVQKKDRYLLVAGHRRLAAAKQAKMKELPCIVRQLTEADLLRYSLIENLQREDLTPLEEAKSIQQLIETLKLDYRSLATLIGKSKSYIGYRMALLDLPDDLKDAVEQGTLPLKKAIELKKIEDQKLRAKLIAKGGTGDLEEFISLIQTTIEKHGKVSKPREKIDVLPGLKVFSKTTPGVRLYRDRISFNFDSQDALRKLLSRVLALLEEQEAEAEA